MRVRETLRARFSAPLLWLLLIGAGGACANDPLCHYYRQKLEANGEGAEVALTEAVARCGDGGVELALGLMRRQPWNIWLGNAFVGLGRQATPRAQEELYRAARDLWESYPHNANAAAFGWAFAFRRQQGDDAYRLAAQGVEGLGRPAYDRALLLYVFALQPDKSDPVWREAATKLSRRLLTESDSYLHRAAFAVNQRLWDPIPLAAMEALADGDDPWLRNRAFWAVERYLKYGAELPVFRMEGCMMRRVGGDRP